jgi:hypothetical protein
MTQGCPVRPVGRFVSKGGRRCQREGGGGNDAVVIDFRAGCDTEGGRREVAVYAQLDNPSQMGGGIINVRVGGVNDASVFMFDTAATPAPPMSTLGKAKGCETVVSIQLGEAPTANRIGDRKALEVPGAAAKAEGAGKKIGRPAIAS